MQSRIRVTPGGLIAGGYVAACGALAVAGAVSGEAGWYLAAVVATLPLGILALVGVYFGYAMLQGVGGLLAPVTTADGSQAGWLHATSSTLNVVLFVVAALGNVLLTSLLRRPRLRAQSRHAHLLP